MRYFIAAGLFFLSFCGSANAQAEKPKDNQSYQLVLNKWASEKDCNPAIAKRVDMDALLANLKTYHNQCVSVDGYYLSRALFLSWEDAQVKRAASNPVVRDARIGLYASETVSTALSRLGKPAYVEVTGLVWDCQDLNGPDVIMVLGYCHYTDGPILGISGFKRATED